MPLNSGMGSKAASSVAALVAINELMGKPYTKQEIVAIGDEGERIACEMHTQTTLRRRLEVWFW